MYKKSLFNKKYLLNEALGAQDKSLEVISTAWNEEPYKILKSSE